MAKPPARKQLHIEDFDEAEDYSKKIETFFFALSIIENILLLTGILANVIVLVVLRRMKRRERTFATFLILQLSITDLVFRTLGLYKQFSEFELEGLFQFSQNYCKFLVFSQYSCGACTFTLLSVIAVDRFIHILYPLRSLQIKPNKTIVILLAWVYAGLVSGAFLYSAKQIDMDQGFRLRRNISFERNSRRNTTGFPVIKKLPKRFRISEDGDNFTDFLFSPERAVCIATPDETLGSKTAMTIYFVFAFVFPLLVMTICYEKILAFLCHGSKHENISQRTMQTKLKAVKMLVVVVLSFLVSWGPLLVFEVLQTYSVCLDCLFKPFAVLPVFQCLSYTSSISNPAIYAYNNAKFRKTLRETFCRKKKHGRK